METFTTLSILLFDTFKIFEMLVSSSRVSDRMSLSSIFCVTGLMGAWPAMKTKPPETTACEYGPRGLGNSGEEITCLSRGAAPRAAATADTAPEKNTIRLFMSASCLLQQFPHGAGHHLSLTRLEHPDAHLQAFSSVRAHFYGRLAVTQPAYRISHA